MSSSSKERPTLQGQRIKTRKRDEKEKFDAPGFRDSLLSGFSEILNLEETVQVNEAGESVEVEPRNGTPVAITQERLDALQKYLENQSAKLDYRKYGEALFDILIAGGILAPGGSIIVDQDSAKTSKTELCVFAAQDVETVRGFAQVFLKVIRRYKYLEKSLEEEFKKIIKFLKGFSTEERLKLAQITGILLGQAQVSPQVLISALQDHFIKDGIAADFLLIVLQTWLTEKDANTIWSSMKKAGLDQKVMDFFPQSKRNAEQLALAFREAGLNQLLDYQKAGLGDKAKKELQSHVLNLIKEDASPKEITLVVKEAVTKNNLAEHEVTVLLWNTLINAVEWNKKEELVAEQAMKHLKNYASIFATFATTPKAELALLNRIQEFCYENMNFLKVFQKIIVLFYKAEVLSEESILKWYKDGHSNKGKSIFLEQMKTFVEWLVSAEEESEEE
ncbi:Basic leucine zipper and W2 domain-containing protein 2 [Halotydeus destructor]|nr:Basic leucine zipper and W2 domain-containing protein 2 [Halotydeus destructor]